MIYRHTDEQLQAYFENSAINQSGLKVIIDPNGGIEKFIEQLDQLQRQEDLYYEEKKHYIIGNGVDCIISQGNDSFKNKYHYVNLKKKPSEAVKSMVNMVYDKVIQDTRVDDLLPFISYKKEICEAADAHEYYPKRKAPTEKHLKEIADAASITDWWNYDNRWTSMKFAEEYWQNLIEANGKMVLSDDEYEKINNIVLSFTTHKFTKHLFKDSKDIDIVFQFPMYWQYLEEDCKGLIDHVIIDHINKRIRPIDEKTIGDYITKFPNAVKKRRYDIQGSFYGYGLHQNLAQLSELLGKGVTEYSIAPLAFVTESTIKPGIPLIYVMNDELERVGMQGDSKWLLGWHQAMLIYITWKEVNYSVERKFEKTNGVVYIDSSFERID